MPVVETYYGPNRPEDKSELFDASSFLGFLRRSNALWQPEDKDALEHDWVYRGQKDSSWPLIPSAARPNSPLKPLTEKFRAQIDDDERWKEEPENAKHITATIVAFARSLTDFILLGNKMGFIDEKGNRAFSFNTSSHSFNLPGSPFKYDGRLEHETLRTFGDLSPYECSSINKGISEMEPTALAQHHQIPTFLLDWTENPWNAAHFASRPPDKDKEQNEICVWALNIKRCGNGNSDFGTKDFGNNHSGILAINRPAKSKNQYLASQAGLMTYLLSDFGHWSKTGEYLDLEGFFEEVASQLKKNCHKLADPEDFKRHYPEGILRKVILAKDHVPELRRLLLLEDITEVHLMPTMDNLAKTSLSMTLDSARS